jgi:transcriptional regulator with XRE-family HTH domain
VNRLRTTSGLTQEALAEKADMSRRYLQEIESGAKSPTVPMLARLRRALNCPWEELLKGL